MAFQQKIGHNKNPDIDLHAKEINYIQNKLHKEWF